MHIQAQNIVRFFMCQVSCKRQNPDIDDSNIGGILSVKDWDSRNIAKETIFFLEIQQLAAGCIIV